jgi:hypothetical protein
VRVNTIGDLMNKKILIGSIIAVVILILVSFTGVVGYQTTKSSTIARASLLFSIRSKRAIDRDSRDLNCDYVGKGEESDLSIPKRDDRAVLIKKAIDSIRFMDDKTFEKVIASIINHAQQDKRFNGVNPDRIREALNQIRNSDKPIPILDANTEKEYSMTADCTLNGGINGFLFCVIVLLWLPFGKILGIIVFIFSGLLGC